MYFVLNCYGPDDQDRAAVGDVTNIKVNWQLGCRFHQAIPNPVMVNLNPDFPGILLPMFNAGILLFTKDMLASVQAAGIDNLDVYDALLRDPANGKTYNHYKAINIIGAVRAADLSKSTYKAHSGSALVDTDFDSLAIDEKKTGNLLLFRLAECVSAIIIHERVKRKLEQDGIPYLDFVEPKDWIG